MSFMLIRLLQTFDSVTLAKDAQPAWSLPPTEWKQSAAQGKRRAREELWPKVHLTLYANVCHLCCRCLAFPNRSVVGWLVGEDERRCEF